MSYIHSEKEVLALIDSIFPYKEMRKNDAVRLPTGSYVTSLDIVGEDLDFRKHTFTAYEIGYKALAVNISDMLAMGAVPRYILMGLTIAQETEEYLRDILQGMADLAQKYNIALLGGDIAFSNSLSFAITIFGEALTHPIERGNCKPEDILFYIPSPENRYPLGLARLGFEVLEQGEHGYPKAIQAQKMPSLLPVEYIEKLAPFVENISLMDISDGLYEDIPRLIGCAQGRYGAEITLTIDMIDKEVQDWCTRNSLDSYEFIYHGGEEYCLLGSAPQDILLQLQKDISTIVIFGKVIDKNIIKYNGREVYPSLL